MWLPHSRGPTQTSQLYKAGIYTGKGPGLAVPPGQRASRIGKAKHSEYKGFWGTKHRRKEGGSLRFPFEESIIFPLS